MTTGGQAILSVDGLRTYFFTRWGMVKAVDGVSFDLGRGETLGLVGESGCGKSVTGLSLLRLVPQPAGKIVGGKVLLNGENLLIKSEAEMQKIRGSRISIVLQDPMTSLNPCFTVGSQLCESIRVHQKLKGRSLWQKACEMLRLVKIAAPEARVKNYPHELSGGMRQRVVGAIALSCQPEVLIADEPTTSLDLTVQAQYLKLLKDIQKESSLSIIFITHDFGIVAEMCDRVAVMYAGRIVETSPTEELFDDPHHPYTKALMAAVPRMDSKKEPLVSIKGEPPALYRLGQGCPFQPRCPSPDGKCEAEYPPQVTISSRRRVACWRAA